MLPTWWSSMVDYLSNEGRQGEARWRWGARQGECPKVYRWNILFARAEHFLRRESEWLSQGVGATHHVNLAKKTLLELRKKFKEDTGVAPEYTISYPDGWREPQFQGLGLACVFCRGQVDIAAGTMIEECTLECQQTHSNLQC